MCFSPSDVVVSLFVEVASRTVLKLRGQRTVVGFREAEWLIDHAWRDKQAVVENGGPAGG